MLLIELYQLLQQNTVWWPALTICND
jgi:hypothetical protein